MAGFDGVRLVAVGGEAPEDVLVDDRGRVYTGLSDGRVVRLDADGERAGRSEVFVDGLSGYPDNIALGSDGLVWVALPSPRSPVLTAVQRMPAPVRRAVSTIPERMQPRPQRTVSVVALDDDGRVVRELRGEIDGFTVLTGVREFRGTLWMGSLTGGSVATLRL